MPEFITPKRVFWAIFFILLFTSPLTLGAIFGWSAGTVWHALNNIPEAVRAFQEGFNRNKNG